MRAASAALAFLAVAAAACGSPATGADAGTDGAAEAGTDAGAAMDAGSDAGPVCPGPFSAPTDAELAVRHRLGIPDDAGCAIVISQSSHLDIDWRSSFDDYYTSLVEGVLDDAHGMLTGDATYRYSIAEMAYLEEHLARHPEQRADLRDAAMRGGLHVVGGGITSPDTLLPTTEALVRDYLRGSLVAENELGVRPRTAWLPDSFGHAPTVPDLLAGMGFEAVAFARVDGLHDAFEHIHRQPLIEPGSTADLLTTLGSADFVWVGPGGGEVLAHWLPFRLYCEGDNLDHTGTPIPGGYLLGDEAPDAAYVNAQIAGYAQELAPLSRTPYMFVPLGCDFARPRPALLSEVARWNATMYPSTGVYVVARTFDDYVDLLADRRAALPRMQLDITPYFEGYFGSRLALKSGIREAGDRLGEAEVLALLAEQLASAPWPAAELGHTWDLFSRTDHHDFITGTSVDDVVTGEQAPLVASLQTSADGLVASSLGALGAALAPSPGGPGSVVVLGTLGADGPREATVDVTLPAGAAHDLSAGAASQLLASTRHPDGSLATATLLVALSDVAPASLTRVDLADAAPTGPVSVTDDGTTVTLTDASTQLVARVDRATGMLTSLRQGATEWLTAPSLEVAEWTDQGGLYRVGSETRGCTFTDAGDLTGAVYVTVLETGPARARVQVTRGDVAIELRMVAGLARLDVDVEASATMAQTLTVRVHTAASGATARFVHAGGAVTRPETRLFTPTFWPVVRALDLARADGTGLALLPRVSTGIRWSAAGDLEAMISRDARSEVCDVLGASGAEDVHAPVSFALVPHAAPVDALALALGLRAAPAVQLTGTGAAATDARLVGLGGHGYVLSALKHAERGAGITLRVERTAADGVLDLAPGVLATSVLARTDLLERSDAPATAHTALDAPLVTLRVGP